MASEQVGADVESPGFFGRNRAPRLITGFVITAVLIVAYLLLICSASFPTGLAWPRLSPSSRRPPAGCRW